MNVRTAQKFGRDLLVTNTIGQIIVIILDALPVVGEAYNVEPATVAAVSTALTTALALYRVIRDQYVGQPA
jgi:hypothetical protein